MAYGTCKLTGTQGTLVKCHLLPKALTCPPDRGEVRVEGGEGRLPVARYDSWFDKSIVTRKGEDIFEKLDDFAIKELRRHKLVWSSWGRDEVTCPVPNDDTTKWGGVRFISFSDPARLRLFCLSLLWRAAVTKLPGFSTITLSDDRRDLIRDMLLSENAAPIHCFPINLIQLTTRGGWHNQSPIKQFLDLKEFEAPTKIGVYRFYFDGLVIRINDELDDPVPDRHKGIGLGEATPQVVLTVPYEGSFQDGLISQHILEAARDDRKASMVERIFASGRRTQGKLA